MEDMDFDSILEEVDGFGTYQRLLLAFVLLPAYVPNGFHAYNQLFMAATPDHFCRVPHLEAMNYSVEMMKNLSIPLEEREGRLVFSQCFMYDLESEDDDESVGTARRMPGRVETLMNASDTLIKIYEDVSHPNTSLPVVACKFGWLYDTSIYSSTIVTEWDIVCEKGFLPTLALVLLGFGGLVGSYVFGNLQDSLGRRPAFFICLTIQNLFGIATGFAVDFWSWLLMRFAVGLTVPAIMGAPFILAMELVGSSKRSLSNILLNIAYSICLMAMAGVAYLVRGWRNLAFTTTLPFFLFAFYWWVLPESPRWLFAHGKLEETERILRRMAHVNGRTLPPDFRKVLQAKYNAPKSEEQEVQFSFPEDATKARNEGNFSILDLFRGRVLRRNTIIITFIWFINMGVYVGLSYYAPILGGDEYLNFFLAGLAEMPTYFFLYPSLEKLGRRWTLFGSLVLGGIACICTILVETETWLKLSLYCIGKFGISAGYVAIQEMAAEIYPTVVRARGMSFSTVISMIGPTLVPLVNYTGNEYMYLPLLILGGLMVVGGVTALALPETLGRPLPQTLADAEKFDVEFSWRGCCYILHGNPNEVLDKGRESSNSAGAVTTKEVDKRRKEKPKRTTTTTATTSATNKEIATESEGSATKPRPTTNTDTLYERRATSESGENSLSPRESRVGAAATTKEVQIHFVRYYGKGNNANFATGEDSMTLFAKENVPLEEHEQEPLLHSTSGSTTNTMSSIAFVPKDTGFSMSAP